MAIEKGIVVKIFTDSVLIEAKPEAGCHSCKVKKQCAMSGDGRTRLIKAGNILSLQIGDSVSFKIDEKAVIFSSILLYLLPVIFLIAGIIVGNHFYYIFKLKQDISEIMGGLLGFLFSFFLIFWISRFLRMKKIFMPVVVKK